MVVIYFLNFLVVIVIIEFILFSPDIIRWFKKEKEVKIRGKKKQKAKLSIFGISIIKGDK